MGGSTRYGTARISGLSATGQIDTIAQRLIDRGSRPAPFVYVDDLITGILALMATPPDFAGPVNLGNPGEFCITELAEK